MPDLTGRVTSQVRKRATSCANACYARRWFSVSKGPPYLSRLGQVRRSPRLLGRSKSNWPRLMRRVNHVVAQALRETARKIFRRRRGNRDDRRGNCRHRFRAMERKSPVRSHCCTAASAVGGSLPSPARASGGS